MKGRWPSTGELGTSCPPPTYVWLYLEPDAEVLARSAADDEGAADQVLSSSFEFIKLLVVPPGDFSFKVAHHLAIDQYRNGRRLVGIEHYY